MVHAVTLGEGWAANCVVIRDRLVTVADFWTTVPAPVQQFPKSSSYHQHCKRRRTFFDAADADASRPPAHMPTCQPATQHCARSNPIDMPTNNPHNGVGGSLGSLGRRTALARLLNEVECPRCHRHRNCVSRLPHEVFEACVGKLTECPCREECDAMVAAQETAHAKGLHPLDTHRSNNKQRELLSLRRKGVDWCPQSTLVDHVLIGRASTQPFWYKWVQELQRNQSNQTFAERYQEFSSNNPLVGHLTKATLQRTIFLCIDLQPLCCDYAVVALNSRRLGAWYMDIGKRAPGDSPIAGPVLLSMLQKLRPPPDPVATNAFNVIVEDLQLLLHDAAKQPGPKNPAQRISRRWFILVTAQWRVLNAHAPRQRDAMAKGAGPQRHSPGQSGVAGISAPEAPKGGAEVARPRKRARSPARRSSNGDHDSEHASSAATGVSDAPSDAPSEAKSSPVSAVGRPSLAAVIAAPAAGVSPTFTAAVQASTGSTSAATSAVAADAPRDGYPRKWRRREVLRRGARRTSNGDHDSEHASSAATGVSDTPSDAPSEARSSPVSAVGRPSLATVVAAPAAGVSTTFTTTVQASTASTSAVSSAAPASPGAVAVTTAALARSPEPARVAAAGRAVAITSGTPARSPVRTTTPMRVEVAAIRAVAITSAPVRGKSRRRRKRYISSLTG